MDRFWGAKITFSCSVPDVASPHIFTDGSRSDQDVKTSNPFQRWRPFFCSPSLGPNRSHCICRLQKRTLLQRSEKEVSDAAEDSVPWWTGIASLYVSPSLAAKSQRVFQASIVH